MSPVFEIALALQYGITVETTFEYEEQKESGRKEIRERINKNAQRLTEEELKGVMSDLENAKEYLTLVINDLANMGFEVTEEVVVKDDEEKTIYKKGKKDYDSSQKFARIIFRGDKSELYEPILLLNLGLKYTEVGIEEISKYLPTPPNVSEEEKLLQKRNEDIDK